MSVEKTVSVIPSNPLIALERRKCRKLRVAAYCRVSTDQEEQQSSYQAQIDYYTEKIANNSEWTLAGIFADEGITGTSAKKRTEFIKLMELCKKGKVDLVLTKSISRFSRNTLDCLGYIRMLRERQIPVIFEKEGINTMQMASEMTISLLGSFAQAESESLSKNVVWGKRQSFKNGIVTFQYSRFLGYERGEDGKPKIIQEQADIVKRIFQRYLDGCSVAKIKKELESDGVLSSAGKAIWSPEAIRYMLKNERYIGDALLQKYYVTDFLTGKSKKNNGEIPQYYVTGNHEGIISKDTFNLVQEEIARRSNKRKVSQKATKTEHGKYSAKYALTELLMCGDCGTQYRRVTWARSGKKKIVWRCINRLEYGTRYCKDSPSIEENKLHNAIMKAISTLISDKDELITTIQDSIHTALNGESGFVDKIATENRIKELNTIMLDMVQLSAKSGSDVDYYDNKFKEISDEINSLKKTLENSNEQDPIGKNTNSRVSGILNELEREKFIIKGYDEVLVKRLIENIKVLSEDKILINYKCGFSMEQNLI